MSRSLLFDIEADGFLDTVTKIHCIVVKHIETDRTYRFYEAHPDIPEAVDDHSIKYARPVFQKATTLIGHNIIGYDNDLLERFLGIDLTDKRIFDTLVWSQTLNPDRKLPRGCPAVAFNPVTGQNDKVGPHSVAAWGYRVARAKPSHHDWLNFSPEMLHRCEEDVAIQEKIMYSLLEEAGIELEEVLI